MAEIEFVTLANHAEAHNGLLYLSGAGWTDAIVGFAEDGRSQPFHFGVGVSILVPWTETNRRHRLTLVVEHEDGGSPLFDVGGELEVGRPVGIPEGADQRSVLALASEIRFPVVGGYRLSANLQGAETRSVSFRVRTKQDSHAAPPP